MPSWHPRTLSLRLSPPAGSLSVCPPTGGKAHRLIVELFRELLDLPTFRRGMARGVVHQALRAVVITIGHLTGHLSPLGPPWPPPAAAAATVGAPASGRLPPAFFLFLLLLLPLPLPWACVPTLGLLSPFTA
jgi:hypothetical protein